MDERTRIASIGLAVFVAAWAGCSPYQAVDGKGVHCEGPRGWRYVPGGGDIAYFLAPETVGGVGAYLAVSEHEVRSRDDLMAAMENNRRLSADDPNFAQETLREIPVAGLTGFLVAETRTQPVLSAHRRGPTSPGVKFREAEVYFSARGRGFLVAFGAPIELYDRHRSAFEHFLASLRIKP